MTNILIEAYVIKNTAPTGGYLPMYSVNKHAHGSTYAYTSYTKTDALAMALQMADKEANRYIGDWNVTVISKLEESE